MTILCNKIILLYCCAKSIDSEIEEEDEDRVDSIDLDPDERVVVSRGIGERFHRPDGLGYDTACKTSFKHSAEEITVSEALEEGFMSYAKY